MKLDKDLVEFNDGEFELMLIEYPRDFAEFVRLCGQVLLQKFTGKITLAQIKSARITDCSDIDWSLDGEKEKGRAVVNFKDFTTLLTLYVNNLRTGKGIFCLKERRLLNISGKIRQRCVKINDGVDREFIYGNMV